MIRTVLVIMGAAFILIGLVGFVSDNFAGTHLTLTHNLIHLVSGAASLYFGLKGSISGSEDICARVRRNVFAFRCCRLFSGYDQHDDFAAVGCRRL